MDLVLISLNTYKVSLVGLLVLITMSCCSILEVVTEPAVPAPCPIENLMVDKSIFPRGWHQTGPPRERSAPIRWGMNKLGVGFITQENGVAGQVVHQGRNPNHAEDGYSDLVGFWFDADKEETDWYTPSEFNYISPIANKYRFGCRTHQPSGVERCQIVGLYGVYLTQFDADMSQMMTYDDLKLILQTIDDKMAKCIGN